MRQHIDGGERSTVAVAASRLGVELGGNHFEIPAVTDRESVGRDVRGVRRRGGPDASTAPVRPLVRDQPDAVHDQRAAPTPTRAEFTGLASSATFGAAASCRESGQVGPYIAVDQLRERGIQQRRLVRLGRPLLRDPSRSQPQGRCRPRRPRVYPAPMPTTNPSSRCRPARRARRRLRRPRRRRPRRRCSYQRPWSWCSAPSTVLREQAPLRARVPPGATQRSRLCERRACARNTVKGGLPNRSRLIQDFHPVDDRVAA